MRRSVQITVLLLVILMCGIVTAKGQVENWIVCNGERLYVAVAGYFVANDIVVRSPEQVISAYLPVSDE